MAGQYQNDGHSVVVTGVSCRFAGIRDTLDQLWESICRAECTCHPLSTFRDNVLLTLIGV